MYIFFIGIISIFIIIFLHYLHINNNSSNNKFNNSVNKLVRQTARWAIAAEQDNNPLIAVLHSNYSAGYLWALKDIATSEEIKNITNINIKTLENKVINIQDKVTKNMVYLCPDYAGDNDRFLSAIAGEG